jgi:chromate transporter
MTSESTTAERKPTPGSIRELVRYFLRLGLLGFGGPVALVGLVAYPILQPDWMMIK